MIDVNTSVDTSCSDGDVRLVGGINEAEGSVEMCYNKFWGSVCHRSWSTADANVVCKQLGYQSAGIVLNYCILDYISLKDQLHIPIVTLEVFQILPSYLIYTAVEVKLL